MHLRVRWFSIIRSCVVIAVLVGDLYIAFCDWVWAGQLGEIWRRVCSSVFYWFRACCWYDGYIVRLWMRLWLWLCCGASCSLLFPCDAWIGFRFRLG